MNAPEEESAGRQDQAAEQDPSLDEIKNEKPLVKSSTGAEPDDQDLESDKPNLPPAMPPVI